MGNNNSKVLDEIEDVESSSLDFCFIENGAKNLIVSFSSINHDGFERKTSLVKMSAEVDVDILYLRGGWYLDSIRGLGDNIDDIILFFKKLFGRYENVICIGSSAGGFGCILYGSLLNVRAVISHMPQTDLEICRKNLPRNPHYRRLAKLSHYEKYSNLKNVINKFTQYYVWSKDAKIVDGLRGKNRLNIVEHGIHHFDNIKHFPNVQWSNFDWKSHGDILNLIKKILKVR